MNYRTDLAMEQRELMGSGALSGIEETTEQLGNINVSRIKVLNDEGAKKLGKPIGSYITVQAPPFSEGIEASAEEIELIAGEIKKMLPQSCGLVFVVGLGNSGITPDALGPATARRTLATRHIRAEVAKAAGLEGLQPVAVLTPGVLGQTGVETGELIASVVREIKPDAVIVIDALASKSVERLGCTIQLSDVGIVPGSGVQNARRALNRETLGVPVIAAGIPTVVDAATLARDLLDNQSDSIKDKVEPRGEAMMVTPREIDVIIERAAKVLSLAINKALQPQLELEDIELLVS